MPTLSIIIPCYNEEKRLPVGEIDEFLQEKKDVKIIFVNDGSVDRTGRILEAIHTSNQKQTKVITLESNRGKAGAVRSGMLDVLSDSECSYAGYIDADLSTSLEEFYDLYLIASANNDAYIFGSRIKMKNTDIQRKFFRHICGRAVASVTDSIFKLGYYDTQCGAKCFKKEITEIIFTSPFKTRWLFDVEIFLRINKAIPEARGKESPLKKWKDNGGSKISLLSFPAIVREIFLLKKNYRN